MLSIHRDSVGRTSAHRGHLPRRTVLQAAGAGLAGARPALLRLDYDAGHGAGSTREQHWQELADMWSFILWQTGDPQFQP